MKDKTGKLIVISAPSGTGKTTVVKKLLEKIPNIIASVSFTTRPMRENEREGIDYFFDDKRKFETMVDDNQFIEHATVFGNYYGTQKESLSSNLKKGKNIILEIDWQGAMEILKTYPDAQSIFISPPSIEELHKRFYDRGLDSEEVITERIDGAKLEMEKSSEFKYQIINNSLETAFKNLLNIIFREKHG